MRLRISIHMLNFFVINLVDQDVVTYWVALCVMTFLPSTAIEFFRRILLEVNR